MLCQLVCLDRRYQRMNCFNIREIQTLLKARFYADLMNESSRHLFLSRTTLNLRFKLQDLSFLNLNSTLANRYGLFTGLVNKSQQYELPLSQTISTSMIAPVSSIFTAGTFPNSTPYLHLIESLSGTVTGVKGLSLPTFSLTAGLNVSFFSSMQLTSNSM